MTVRSDVLGRASFAAASADVVIYTCPADHTAIVKHVSIANTAVTTQVMQLYVQNGAPFWYIAGYTMAGSSITKDVDMWVVLRPGDQLKLFKPATASGTVYASGAELAGVAP